MEHSVQEGFLAAEQLNSVRVSSDPLALLGELAALSQRSGASEDFSRI